MWVEILINILIGGMVEGLVIIISYLIIQYLRKRRIIKGFHCPYCREDIKHEYKNNMNYCNRCGETLKFLKKKHRVN